MQFYLTLSSVLRYNMPAILLSRGNSFYLHYILRIVGYINVGLFNVSNYMGGPDSPLLLPFRPSKHHV